MAATPFNRHLETVAGKSSLRITLLRRVKHLLGADGLLTLYKAQVRPIMEYCALTWMSSSSGHLSLLDKVQRRAERLINSAAQHQQRQMPRAHHQHRHQHPQQHHQQADQEAATAKLDSLQHRRRVAALSVIYKSQMQQEPHLAALRLPWRRTERSTRTVLTSVYLLEIPRSRTSTHQRTFSAATSTLWNAFVSEVNVERLSLQQVKVAAYNWCRTHPL